MGDDIPHAPIPFNPVPDFVSSKSPSVTDDTLVDFVFIDFIAEQLVMTLNSVQTAKVYTTADAQVYSPLTTNQIYGVYAQVAWN